ncbi:MAG: hypothetical protein AAGA02_07860, partial [Bacteroidota bacterium]
MYRGFLFVIMMCMGLVFPGPGYAQDSPIDTLAKVNRDSTSVINQAAKRLDPPSLSEIISFAKIFWAIVFLVAGYFIIRFIGSILSKIAEKSTTYRITIKGIIPVFNILGWVFI